MSQPKKVLLITYYWPPAGGAGVQRWLKMSKYLRSEFNLTIYHPSNADYPIIDDSLMSEIPEGIQYISQPIKEPYSLAKKLNANSKKYQKGQIEPKQNQSKLSKMALWIRANLFIPDARKWWIKPSFKFLNKYILDNPQDVIITTGPPHSMHVIGLKLKQSHPKLKWLADFRDPWTEIDYFDKLPFTKRSISQHKKLEQDVLQSADVVTTVSKSWAKSLENIANKEVEVIYNGYDSDDFGSVSPPDHKFSMTYIGSLNDDRNPSALWEVLNELCLQEEFANEFELKLIGNISDHIKSEITSYPNLRSKTQFVPYLPHHDAIKELINSQILLLLINNTSNEQGIIPGKFFEYLAAKRTILCLGKKGSDIDALISKVKAGVLVDRSDKDKLKSIIQIWFHEYQGGLLNSSNYRNISIYSRKKAAMDFAQLIEKL